MAVPDAVARAGGRGENGPARTNARYLTRKQRLGLQRQDYHRADEDLFGLPSEQEIKTFQAVPSELNSLIQWCEALTRSPYARLYPGFEIKAPEHPAPQLLVLLHKANQPLPPVYDRMSAEWVVDHWQFGKDAFNFPDPGQPRSSFTGDCVVKGSTEAAALLAAERDAIAQAKPKKAAIDSAYAADLVKATRPGILYRGQISHQGNVVPVEVRFVESPTSDPEVAQFELHLLTALNYRFIYSAKLARRVPVQIRATAGSDQPMPPPEGTEAIPRADLSVNFVSASGKEGVLDNSVPAEFLNIVRHYSPPSDISLSVFDHHLKGRLNGFATDGNGFVLSAQQTP